MKASMKVCKLPDTHPGDDLYSVRLHLTEMTEREAEAAIAAIVGRVYPDVMAVVFELPKK